MRATPGLPTLTLEVELLNGVPRGFILALVVGQRGLLEHHPVLAIPLQGELSGPEGEVGGGDRPPSSLLSVSLQGAPPARLPTVPPDSPEDAEVVLQLRDGGEAVLGRRGFRGAGSQGPCPNPHPWPEPLSPAHPCALSPPASPPGCSGPRLGRPAPGLGLPAHSPPRSGTAC